jgi:hypothetical protein
LQKKNETKNNEINTTNSTIITTKPIIETQHYLLSDVDFSSRSIKVDIPSHDPNKNEYIIAKVFEAQATIEICGVDINDENSIKRIVRQEIGYGISDLETIKRFTLINEVPPADDILSLCEKKQCTLIFNRYNRTFFPLSIELKFMKMNINLGLTIKNKLGDVKNIIKSECKEFMQGYDLINAIGTEILTDDNQVLGRSFFNKRYLYGFYAKEIKLADAGFTIHIKPLRFSHIIFKMIINQDTTVLSIRKKLAEEMGTSLDSTVLGCKNEIQLEDEDKIAEYGVCEDDIIYVNTSPTNEKLIKLKITTSSFQKQRDFTLYPSNTNKELVELLNLQGISCMGKSLCLLSGQILDREGHSTLKEQNVQDGNVINIKCPIKRPKTSTPKSQRFLGRKAARKSAPFNLDEELKEDGNDSVMDSN